MQSPFKSGLQFGLGLIASMFMGGICIALLGQAVNAADETIPARNLIVAKDKITGCEYLIYAGSYSSAPVGPRLDQAGKPICRSAH